VCQCVIPLPSPHSRAVTHVVALLLCSVLCVPDYDRRLLIHQPHSLRSLHDELLPSVAKHAARSSSSFSSATLSAYSSPSLFDQVAWHRAMTVLRRYPHVQISVSAFQHGPSTSVKWIGPRPASADKRMQMEGESAPEEELLLRAEDIIARGRRRKHVDGARSWNEQL
jgi:hypothetical protein